MEQMEQQGKVYDITFLACGLISLLVGGIVVANILMASFTERMREVGVRKALGAKGWHIAVQFLVESAIVTGLGGAIGLVLGVGFVHGIAYLLDQVAVLTPTMILAAMLSAGTVGLVVRLLPGDQGGAPRPGRGAEVRVMRALAGFAFSEAVRTTFAEMWSHKLRSSLTLIGVILGTLAVVVMVTMIEGIKVMVWEGIRGHGVRRRDVRLGPAPGGPHRAEEAGDVPGPHGARSRGRAKRGDLARRGGGGPPLRPGGVGPGREPSRASLRGHAVVRTGPRPPGQRRPLVRRRRRARGAQGRGARHRPRRDAVREREPARQAGPHRRRLVPRHRRRGAHRQPLRQLRLDAPRDGGRARAAHGVPGVRPGRRADRHPVGEDAGEGQPRAGQGRARSAWSVAPTTGSATSRSRTSPTRCCGPRRRSSNSCATGRSCSPRSPVSRCSSAGWGSTRC